MDRAKLMKNFNEPDERLLFSKAFDQALLCEKRKHSTFSDFLNPLSARKFREVFDAHASLNIMAFGGASGCERLMLGFFSEYDEPLEDSFPIDAVEIISESDKLTHRDYLGSILGTGVSRDRVGDIFIFEGRATAFLEREITRHVLSSLTKVGNFAVSAAIIEREFLIAPFTEGRQKDVIVASLRLDAVVAAAFNLSRGKAAKAVESEKVFVNWQVVKSASKLVEQGDNITFRGYGRAQIEAINGRTKKENISVTLKVTN